MDLTGRLGTPYGEALVAQATSAAGPAIEPGVSGYFTPPGVDLDPALFAGDRLRPAVRKLILNQVDGYLATIYRDVEQWLRVWIAGSGASYQWAADREPRDLDVLCAIDHVRFRQHNPDYAGLSNDTIDAQMTQRLKTGLWPRTAHTLINGSHYEATYFVNPGHEDIREINPYAAYDVRRDKWSVRPIEIPSDFDPLTAHPEWWAHVTTEQGSATAVVQRYNAIKDRLAHLQPGSPQWINAENDLVHVVAQGAALFDSIHGDRQRAFSMGGQGYFDFYNFRWQAYKRSGLTPALHEMKSQQVTAQQAAEGMQYGGPIMGAHDALTAATLYAQSPPRSAG